MNCVVPMRRWFISCWLFVIGFTGRHVERKRNISIMVIMGKKVFKRKNINPQNILNS